MVIMLSLVILRFNWPIATGSYFLIVISLLHM